MEDPTEALAKAATELLHSQGRTDLSVSGLQVLKWRRDFDAVPVVGDRKGGRSRPVQYAPDAGRVVAAIAEALDEDRSMERAILDVFGRGFPVPEKAVRRAYRGHLLDVEDATKRAWSKRHLPRSEVPRSLRFPLKGSRKAGSSVITETFLSVLLGKDLPGGSYGISAAVTELIPAVGPYYADADDRERLLQLIGRVGLAALRLVVSRASIEGLTQACSDIRVTIDYSDAIRRCIDVTGSDFSQFPSDVEKLLRLMDSLGPQVKGKRFGVGVAILGLVLYSATPTRKTRSELRNSIETFQYWIPKFESIADLTESLPEDWRPALAPVAGALFTADLSEEHREGLASEIKSWKATHPTQALHLDEMARVEKEKLKTG